MVEERNPIFAVYYEDEGRKQYSLVQAKNEDEAKEKFHTIWLKKKEIVEVRKITHL